MMDQPTFTNAENARTVARAALAPRATGHLQSGHTWELFVSLFRKSLPVLTVMAAAAIIVWPFFNTTEVSFTLSRTEVAESDGKIRLSGLRYTGSDAKDRPYRISARSGVQDDPEDPQIRLDQIRAEMDLNANQMATMTALSGTYWMRDRRLALAGDVEVLADNGYQMLVSGAEIDLRANIARGRGSVRGRAPLGTLSAGQMEVNVTTEELVLTNGVRLHIEPRRDGLVPLTLPAPLDEAGLVTPQE